MKQRLERALDLAQRVLRAHGTIDCNQALIQIDSILHPVEVIEEEVVRWECSYCGVISHEAPSLDTHYNCCQEKDKTFIKLSGSFRRKNKVVERSVSATVSSRSQFNGSHWIEIPERCECPAAGTIVTIEWTE